MFHISDEISNTEKDEHLNIGEGDYDFEFLMECVKRNNSTYITLETPRLNQETLKEDIRNITLLKRCGSIH
jgi:deoxyribonuclease-4